MNCSPRSLQIVFDDTIISILLTTFLIMYVVTDIVLSLHHIYKLTFYLLSFRYEVKRLIHKLQLKNSKVYVLDQQNSPNVKDSDLSYISLVIISNLNCTAGCR